jgi:tRNA threonylcarbamoyl adenosine modification protein (Sua5/YciO/YrdC/YwlC family)
MIKFQTLLIPLLVLCCNQCSPFKPPDSKALRGIQLGAKKGKKSPTIVSIEDLDSDIWKCESIVEILQGGGVGVIPTDTCYSFVTQITNLKGIDRIAELKGMKNQKKPLSILCKDYSTVARYTQAICDQKWAFKLLKSTLPGAFTYILPSSKEIPKIVVEHNQNVKRFKRKEIGIRMPADPICEYLLARLDVPLLCGSVPEASEDVIGMIFHSIDKIGDKEENQWRAEMEAESSDEDFDIRQDYIGDISSVRWLNRVDFVLENGPRGLEGPSSLSTVVDLTSGAPVVIRQGRGLYDFAALGLSAD